MRIVSALLLGLFASTAFAELHIHNAIVPEAPPSARVLTAYMQLHNPSEQAQTITAISSPQFKRVSMHRTEVVDDIARMLPVEHIRIAPGKFAELKPGGMHLMMHQPNKRYKHGDSVELILQFADGSNQHLHAQVKRRGELVDHSHHAHH